MNIFFQSATITLIAVSVLLWIATIILWYRSDSTGFEPLNVFIAATITTLFAFLNWLKSKNPSSDQLNSSFVNAETEQERTKYFQQILGINTNIRYKEEQFDIYKDTWKKLQKLRLAGDALWQEANEENVIQFYLDLSDVSKQINIYAPLFDEQHYDDLWHIISKQRKYVIGKEQLIELDSQNKSELESNSHLREWNPQIEAKIKRQIQRNKKLKADYENLLDEILISFRNKLSGKQKENNGNDL